MKFIFPQNKLNIKVYPGMFDFIKGIGMLSIPISHSISHYTKDLLLSGGNANLIKTVLSLYDFISFGNVMMVIFFITSGFSFKKSDPISCLKKQAKFLLLPILYIIAAACIISLVAYSVVYRNIGQALNAILGILLSFTLGVIEWKTVFGFFVPGMFATWFLVALFVSWNVLNLIMNYIPEKWRTLTVIIASASGYVVGKMGFVQYGIAPGLVAVLFLYCGYKIKKNKLMSARFPVLFYILAGLVWICDTYYCFDDMASSYWELGYVSVILSIPMSLVLIQAYLLINKYSNGIINYIRRIGRYSLWFICIHTTEQLCIPWIAFVYSFTSHNALNCLIYIIIRLVLDIIALELLIFFTDERKNKRLSSK